jgi:hypothetical protein
MKEIFEARDVTVYKKLISLLGDYTSNYAFSGVTQLFNQLTELGIKSMPKDSRALLILDVIGNWGSSPASVQDLLNLRFSALESIIRPVIRNGRKKEVAFWFNGEKISERVLDLLRLNGKSGYWCDINGRKVKLIDNVAAEKDYE